ncbi:tetratricopeptide repeat protein [Tumebacillus sp. DT12]|uniref:Tetratricopeptide repeat protein n=1 Tax=Tumebacillus lacus TaxID=2995335 RepID=A0ABT3X315_9BACL|nr:tetratricopeptide repeat protein [Tumebacillus lacus]MCX7569950.1 tetratricopeptide repeat protein [Tumebacillus lacus]
MRRVLFVPWSVMLRARTAPLDGRQGALARQVPRYLSLRLDERLDVEAQFAPYCSSEDEEAVFLVPGDKQSGEELREIGMRYDVDLVISGQSEFGDPAHVSLQFVEVASGVERERLVIGSLADGRLYLETLLGAVMEEVVPHAAAHTAAVSCEELSTEWAALAPFFCAIDRLMAMEIGAVEEDPRAPFELFFEALEHDPNWSDGADQLIGAALDYGLEGQGPMEVGIESLERMLLILPQQHKAWGALGYLYFQEEQPVKAITCLENCARLAPAEFASHHRLGAAYRQVGRHKEAIAVLQSGLLIDPDNIPMLIELGAALGESDRAAEAVPYFQRAVDLSPISGAFYGNLAVALKRCGRVAEAEEVFRAGMGAVDPHWNVYANYAIQLEETGRNIEWASVLFQGVQALVDQPDEREDLAERLVDGVRVWIAEGLPEDVARKGMNWAIGLLESLVELLPDCRSSRVVLAEFYRSEQRPERALECLHSVEAEDPDNVWLKIHIGSVLAGEERYEEATDRFRQALALDDGNQIAVFNLMLLAAMQNRYREALGYLDRYRELVPTDPDIGRLEALVEGAGNGEVE